MGSLAFKIKDLDEDDVSFGSPSKECSNCDPDIPGHVEKASCLVCKGTGRELLSFAAAFAEVCASKHEEDHPKKPNRGSATQGSFGDHDYDDDDDTPGDLEYDDD